MRYASLLLILSGCAIPWTTPRPDTVSRVNGGNRVFIAELDGIPNYPARIAGVRIAGLNDPMFQEAWDFSTRWVSERDETVMTCTGDGGERLTDNSSRVMIVVTDGGTTLNHDLVRRGYGKVDRRCPVPADLLRDLEAAEKLARQERLGVWAGGDRPDAYRTP